MQKSDNTKTAVSAHRKVRSSTTLNRRYVKRPVQSSDITVVTRRSPKVRHFSTPAPSRLAEERVHITTPVMHHPLQKTANQKIRDMRNTLNKPSEPSISAKEIKEREIKKAIASAKSTKIEQKEVKMKQGLRFGFGRIVLALSCAALTTFAIAYFVNLNMPDLSLRVAAIQTGIEASYPSYIPRGYSTSSISSEDGKVVLDFHNSAENKSFTIIEEVSSWDSNALLANYVKTEFGENYSTVREQGLTIYVSGSNAAWVNGGILYKIDASSDVLSNKQIRSIAVSL